ncbi:MAG: hypothetical protein M1828_003849 [Chrysothrix sp. TS-e1954]|nr:MAG: hypothetical protein M1828_003849 [Chrysothrix sp. TS-e1954]
MVTTPAAPVDEPLLEYDYVLRVAFAVDENASGVTPRTVQDVLRKGFGDRVRGLNVITSSDLQAESMVFGLTVNAETVARTIDRGPPAEKKEQCRLFREFWKAKAELRRFRDGTIQEAVVWTCKDSLSLLREIATFVLQTHTHGGSLDKITFVGQDSAFLLKQQVFAAGNADALTDTFEKLQKTLRNLDGLPLAIHQVQPATLLAERALLSPADIVIQFEASARWPDDLRAIQVTKVAFLLKLDDLLQTTVPGLTTRVGRENELCDLMNASFLDVMYPNGAMYRLRIFHDREQTLLQRVLMNKTVAPHEREMAGNAWADYKRTFIKRPLHARSLSNLVTRYPAFLQTIRLVKTWFNAHLLGAHFADELIELFVAHVFVHPEPWQPPATALTGLLRVLWSLSMWDWHHDLGIIDFNQTMSKEEKADIRTRFDAWRKIDPKMNRLVLFVATNWDQEGTTWTDFKPSKVIAARMVSLARASCDAFRGQALAFRPETIFASPRTDYDFFIHVDRKFSGTADDDTKAAKFKNLQKPKPVDMELADYTPAVEYARELERLYGDSAIFLYSTGSCDSIAGIWKPHTARCRWKLKLPYSSIQMQGQGQGQVHEDPDALINKDAILNEMARLGADMVSRVEVNH